MWYHKDLDELTISLNILQKIWCKLFHRNKKIGFDYGIVVRDRGCYVYDHTCFKHIVVISEYKYL
jgi:hypothetical protein